MLRVGLTGGIGAGKSSVARRLAELGAVVVDADRLARQVVEPGSEGLAAVVEAFGTGVLTTDGALDRAALGAIVFGDDEARLRLNGLLHPRIARLTHQRFADVPPDAVAVHDVPLLVENRMGANYHLVLVVHASHRERVRRLVEDRAMAEADVLSRIASQADDAARRAAADVWIDNGGSVEDTVAEVDRLWAQRIVPFEENLRTRRPAPEPPRGWPVTTDPGWSAQAARLVARVRRAAGDDAVRVEHVGPSAVPGATTRDVVDLLLVVRGGLPDAELADRLVNAGFVPTSDALPGDERFACGTADPGRPATLLVRDAVAEDLRT